jgi:hypothetical protein
MATSVVALLRGRTQSKETFHERKDSGLRLKTLKVCIKKCSDTSEEFLVPEECSADVILGYGGFGIVLGVTDNSTKEHLAIKKVSNAFHNHIDAKRLYREIKIMQHVDHPNLLSMRQCYIDGNTVYVSSRKMDTNLKRVIDYDLQKLTLRHIKYCVFQVLCGLKYLHSCGIVHRFIPFFHMCTA